MTRAEIIIISISSQGLRGFVSRILEYDVADKDFVLCMKGIEVATGARLSEVLTQSGISPEHVAVWVGPGHIQAFTQGIPNCMVIDSASEELKKRLADSFKSDLIRFYYGTDLIGTEIGAAAKNVIGIVAGVLDGCGYVSLRGALMSRGAREVARLIKAMGGNELSAYGFAHLGDYEATLFSEYSHNRMYGEMLVKDKKFEKLAEGVPTAAAMKKLGEKYGVDLPITCAVFDLCYGEGEEGEDYKARCMKLLANLYGFLTDGDCFQINLQSHAGCLCQFPERSVDTAFRYVVHGRDSMSHSHHGLWNHRKILIKGFRLIHKASVEMLF